MHAQFVYSATKALGITEVTEPNGFKPGQDAGLGLRIAQISELVREDLVCRI